VATAGPRGHGWPYAPPSNRGASPHGWEADQPRGGELAQAGAEGRQTSVDGGLAEVRAGSGVEGRWSCTGGGLAEAEARTARVRRG
jgi:hypothetical protein